MHLAGLGRAQAEQPGTRPALLAVLGAIRALGTQAGVATGLAALPGGGRWGPGRLERAREEGAQKRPWSPPACTLGSQAAVSTCERATGPRKWLSPPPRMAAEEMKGWALQKVTPPVRFESETVVKRLL